MVYGAVEEMVQAGKGGEACCGVTLNRMTRENITKKCHLRKDLKRVRAEAIQTA